MKIAIFRIMFYIYHLPYLIWIALNSLYIVAKQCDPSKPIIKAQMMIQTKE